jgi:hypothetical protein
MINVIIPSYGRAHDLKGVDYFSMAKYCVPQSQADQYMEVVGAGRVVALPDDQDGDIAKKRNWILQNIPRPLIMIDDDVSELRYWDVRDQDDYLSSRFPSELLPRLFRQMVDVAEEFGVKMFGVAQNKDDRSYREFMPFSLSNIVLGPFQGHLDHNLRFDPKVGSKDDYDMALQQLNKYKKVLRFNKFAYDCDHGDNSGGIVSYRTQEKEVEWCKQIMVKWGKSIISYRIPPRSKTDLLNAKSVNVPIKGV